MGLSGIGYRCGRMAQYSFRSAFVKKIGHRLSRIFNTGHGAEEFMIADLKRIGIEVYGEQESITGFAGHWKGHIDGRCIGVIESPKTEHLVEFKTMNDKSFKDTVKKKVKASKPGYYDQMQAYMGYLKLTRALFMAYNKNDSSYYIERVKFDSERFAQLKEKELIILEESPVARIGNPITWFECKFCDARDLCMDNVKPVVSCRTCQHVDILDEGKWECSRTQLNLTLQDQANGCSSYRKSDFFTASSS